MNKYIFLQGTNNYLINKQEQKTITEIRGDGNLDCNLVIIDFEVNSFSEFLDELLTVSLFQNTKIISISNISKIKDYTSQDKKILTNFFKDNNLDTYIIVKSANENVSAIPFYEIIKLFFQIDKIEIPSKNELFSYAQNKFKNADKRISTIVLNNLLDKVGYDPALLDSEIEKLILYKDKDKEITDVDLETMLPIVFEQDIFKLTKYYLSGDIDNAIKTFNLLMSSQTSPHSILALFEKTITNLYLIKRLILLNTSDSVIAKKMLISDGKLYYLRKDLTDFTAKTLEQTITEIADIDYKVKAGLIDPGLALELFLLKRR